MTLLRADSAKVQWDSEKKRWLVRIQVGEEVIRRPCGKASAGASDVELKNLAIETAKDEGYDLAPESITVVR